jgi:accessory gene regulator B
MIAVLSDRIARFIREHDPNAASKEVLIYGISAFLHSLLTLVLIFAVCFITDHIMEAFIAIFSFVLLRCFSGGVHLHSSWKCDIVSTLAMVGLAHSHYSFGYLGWVVNAVAFIIVAVLAPQNPNLTYRLVEKHKGKLKWISVGIVSVNFFIQSPLVANAFLLQSLSLTKPFHRFFALIDGR